MQLWNDYEGTTLAGQWKLGALLRTEGRSALFATTRADGSAAVLRLTEALNDQAVLQARYRSIQAAGDQFLVKVEGFGDAELDGAPLSYAVLEPTEESLADILSQRSLAVDETYEVASTVAGGLLALHAHGLVHGLVVPESVLAAGERIKLRSDCARPAAAPEDAMLEGALTAESDALGLAGVIFQSLTRNRLQDASDALALPEPFASIVRNTVRQAWGVAEIQAELERSRRAQKPVLPPGAASVAPSAAQVQAAGSATAAVADSGAPVQQELPLSTRRVSSGADGGAVGGADGDAGWQKPVQMDAARRRGIVLAVATVMVAVLLFVGLHHGRNHGRNHGHSGDNDASAAVMPSTMAAPRPAPTPAATTIAAPAKHEAATAPAPALALAPGAKAWRVIAYTYDRKIEAEAKAASLNQRFAGFNAQAWSRTGSRPFLVTLGGLMPKADAFALRAKARHAGIARDVYAQNYKE